MELRLEFCTNFNGVFIQPVDYVNLSDDQYDAQDRVADTLPSMTYDFVKDRDVFDSCQLTDDQEQALIDKARELIGDAFGSNPTIVFEYNTIDS